MQRYSLSSQRTCTVSKPLFKFLRIPLTNLACKMTSTYAYSPFGTLEPCLLTVPTHLPSFFNGIILSVNFLGSPQNTILLWFKTDCFKKLLLAARTLISALCLISGWRTNYGLYVLNGRFIFVVRLSNDCALKNVRAMFLISIWSCLNEYENANLYATGLFIINIYLKLIQWLILFVDR